MSTADDRILVLPVGMEVRKVMLAACSVNMRMMIPKKRLSSGIFEFYTTPLSAAAYDDPAAYRGSSTSASSVNSGLPACRSESKPARRLAVRGRSIPDVVAAAAEQMRRTPRIGFSDCLIFEVARKAGHLPLGTFNRDLGKLSGTEKL